jgi:KUP system potassium uptake protein
MKTSAKFSSFKEIVQAMGLVFGDIGTSPIYTITVVFALLAPTRENLFGVLSLIFWSLIILVTLEYGILAMSLSIKGEGGIIVLKEIITNYLKKGRKAGFAAFLGYVGVSLLMGDGVITPAISILSAVEGLRFIPGVGEISTNSVIVITSIITILLFSFQYKGTDKVSSSFGPIMVIWFSSLFISGIIQIVKMPGILTAISPHYAVEFMLHNGLAGFFVLSEVILCATGGEALYADMGHLGSQPIRHAWYFVFIALVVNYFGQGAYVIATGHTESILFGLVRSYSAALYVPFLILTLLATIIASQAMISAIMSLVYQGINTHIFPLMRIKYTSTHLKSQIYIGSVNWMLLIAVLFMVFLFKKSDNLAAAYGLAVTATMTISATFMIWVFKIQKDYFKMSAAIFVLMVDITFLLAVIQKIPHGGYWSLVIASVPLFVIMLWLSGNKAMHKAFRALPAETFLFSFKQIYKLGRNISGTALFFTRSFKQIPPYVVHCIIKSNIIYEKNILVSIATMDEPYGVRVEKVENIAEGLTGVKIEKGYMEVINIHDLLEENGIQEKIIFYGVDDIVAHHPLKRLYAFMKRITPPFIHYYDLPYNKLHGVVTRIEI